MSPKAGLLWALLFCLACPNSAGASEITSRLERLSQHLTKSYTQAKGSAGHPTVAVFTFSSSEKLARQRTGFAISELLTHHLAANQTFAVVERAESHGSWSRCVNGYTAGRRMQG